MLTEICVRCDTIEECYEFTLAYAAQGLSSDQGRQAGDEVRGYLHRALARDARDSLAAIELVLAQPAISSQLVDNLNASIHLRALLTDLFLVTEMLKPQAVPAKLVNTG